MLTLFKLDCAIHFLSYHVCCLILCFFIFWCLSFVCPFPIFNHFSSPWDCPRWKFLAPHLFLSSLCPLLFYKLITPSLHCSNKNSNIFTFLPVIFPQLLRKRKNSIIVVAGVSKEFYSLYISYPLLFVMVLKIIDSISQLPHFMNILQTLFESCASVPFSGQFILSSWLYIVDICCFGLHHFFSRCQLNTSPNCHSYNAENCMPSSNFSIVHIFWGKHAFANLLFFMNYIFQLRFCAREISPQSSSLVLQEQWLSPLYPAWLLKVKLLHFSSPATYSALLVSLTRFFCVRCASSNLHLFFLSNFLLYPLLCLLVPCKSPLPIIPLTFLAPFCCLLL